MIKKHSIFMTLLMLSATSLAMASDIQREFSVDGDATLKLRNIAGDIEVRPGTSDRIVVHVDRDNDNVEVDMFQNGDRVTIKVRYPQRNQKSNKGSVDFRIEFPAKGSSLELSSISGSIEVKGIQADLKLKTISGNIKTQDAVGDLKLGTVSGDIEMDDTGRASIDASTISGDVEYRKGKLNGGDFSFSSTSGDIDIYHAASASYEISGRTLSGTISNRVGDSIVVKVAKYTGSQSVSGSYGGTDVWIEANTVSGDIKLRKY